MRSSRSTPNASSAPITALVAIFTPEKNWAILLIPVLGFAYAGVAGTAPGSLPGLSNGAFGIGSSLGFAWAGPVVGQGTVAGFHSTLWISFAIWPVALGMSLVLKPRPAE
jgi:hypothetical protein